MHNSNEFPEVSVIMPAYNAATFIERSLQSVLDQSFKNWECLVADDQSTDQTAEIVRKFQAVDSRIKLVKCPSKMFTALARNEALKQASGRYIAFLDSDDLWHPHKLEKQLAFMKNADIPFSFHTYQYIDDTDARINRFVKAPQRVSYQDMLGGNRVGCLTVMYDAKSLGKVFMRDGFHTREDYVCWFDILSQIPYGVGLDEVLAFYRIHPNAASASKLVAAKRQWNVYRKYLKYSYLQAAYWMVAYAFMGIRKHGYLG